MCFGFSPCLDSLQCLDHRGGGVTDPKSAKVCLWICFSPHRDNFAFKQGCRILRFKTDKKNIWTLFITGYDNRRVFESALCPNICLPTTTFISSVSVLIIILSSSVSPGLFVLFQNFCNSYFFVAIKKREKKENPGGHFEGVQLRPQFCSLWVPRVLRCPHIWSLFPQSNVFGCKNSPCIALICCHLNQIWSPK